MKFHLPSFLLGTGVGALIFFAVLNGGACRPSPTPTDEGTPVSVPMPPSDKPIAPMPVAQPEAPAEIKTPEVKPEAAPISIEVSPPSP